MPSAIQTALLLLISLCALATAASAEPRTGQAIASRPGAITVLAEAMSKADDGQRWEFADTVLDVLLSTYDDELQSATSSRPNTEKRRKKLYRWQRATRDLMERIIDARLRLSEGANAIIHVDAQKQILLFIGEQTIAFSAPRPGTERRMEAQVIERYCALNDCSVLGSEDAATTQTLFGMEGTWSMHDRRLPTFEIAGLMHCTFADLRNRDRKQVACLEAAVEAESLIDAVTGALHSGHAFDWQRLAGGRSTSGPDTLLRINAAGDYLRIGAPRLARINDADWSALMRSLRHRIESGAGSLHIEQAERLLYDD